MSGKDRGFAAASGRTAWLTIAIALLCTTGVAYAQHGDPSVTEGDSAVITAGTFTVGGQPIPAELGSFSVPAVRTTQVSDNATARFTLRFVRFASTAHTPGSPIVFLAGGPGDAATRAFVGMPRAFLDSLRAIADVIAFDQRGTGRSQPLSPLCPPGSPWPADRPGNPAVQVDSVRARLSRCLARATAQGLDVHGLTTWESADDLAALARVLGSPTLSLLAGSYGTHLALATAARHPALVDRMILAGVEGPDHTLKEPMRVEEVLATIAIERRPTLLTDLRTLRERLTDAPITVPLSDGSSVVVGGGDLERWVTDALDAVPEINAVIAAIPQLLRGDYSSLGRWAESARRPRPLNLMNVSMDCASYASTERLVRIREQTNAGVFGGAINTPLPGVCDTPGLPRLPDAFRVPVRATARTLLIAGTFDGRTPVANAEEVASGLPNGELLVIPGVAHSLMGHPLTMAALLRVLRAP